MVLFLFEVVFMETAGYIIIGAIAERISFAGVPLRRGRDGRDHLPDLRQLGVGRRLARRTSASRCTSGTARSTSPDRASCTRPAGWAALALAMVLGPRIGKYQRGRHAERDPRPQHPATS